MASLTLGILAHVDAGKTSLTERLLYAAGVIDEIGSVDDGSTQTDSMALEQQRGITIRSAVVSFAVDDVTVNLIDTPGHPDFIAEVERVLGVLDGVVLVISAVEGVQPQTRALMRVLQRLRIPTILFVNKIDRAGARYDDLLRTIAEKLTPAIAPMGTVDGLGTRAAVFRPYRSGDHGFSTGLVDLLAERDDAFLAAYVRGEEPDIRAALAAQSRRALLHPVYFGSAITGAGVAELIAGITEFLPGADGDADSPVAGSVFKVERSPAGEKIAYLRLFAGTVRVRDRVVVAGGREEKVTGIGVFDHGVADPRPAVTGGRIAKVWGLGTARIGDAIGTPRTSDDSHLFAPPTLETVVVPCHERDAGPLFVALTQLAEQDPLINVRRDDVRQETSVSLYGEVQKEVIQAVLADDFGIDVTFRETTTICIERLVGAGEAVEFMGKGANPFLATVGLRVEPAPLGSGVAFQLGVELGSMPFAFFAAVEDTVRETLGQGLYGWQVPDCVVTMTHSGYAPRQSRMGAKFDKSMSSTGADFRGLTPLVLMTALRKAGTRVHEPMHRFRLEIPAEMFGTVVPALARMLAVPQTAVLQGSSHVLEGTVVAARVRALEQQLPALTSGEGVLECGFDHYEPVRGASPTRTRSDHNPLNRKDYLLHVLRRV
ncbi:MAG TPA: translation factor GTPase family protein [Micromonosporaceae bacterium]|nr:translation factor GTPase family protein [Micromonosporaceae bacterium]